MNVLKVKIILMVVLGREYVDDDLQKKRERFLSVV